jgi:small subunit ribosomal protein S15
MKHDEKKKLFKKFGKHEKDTGSAQVQVALLTTRINQLTEHLKSHKNDQHSRQGLLKMVGKRRRHLTYLSTKNKDQYEKVIADLDLRK